MNKVPLQSDGDRHINEDIAREAYKEYVAQFGTGQSFERLHQRGGFGAIELATLLFKRIQRLNLK